MHIWKLQGSRPEGCHKRINVDNNSATVGHDFFDDHHDSRKTTSVLEASDCIIEIREYDVPYHVRVAIDKGRFELPLYQDLNIVTNRVRYPGREMVHG